MSPTGKFTLRLVIYGAFLLYLVGDLFVWHGFLAGRMDAYLKPLPGPPGDSSARIAEVYGEPVTANQLSRRITELKMLRQPPVLDMEGGIDLPNAAPLCALANQFHNLDTVRRVLDEIDAGQTPEAAVKAVRRQIQPISPARS